VRPSRGPGEAEATLRGGTPPTPLALRAGDGLRRRPLATVLKFRDAPHLRVEAVASLGSARIPDQYERGDAASVAWRSRGSHA